MFRIGLPEIIIIALVILLFVNPKEFPGFFRKAGTLFKQIKDMRDEFKQTMSEFEAELRSAVSPAAPASPTAEASPGGSAGTGTVIHTSTGPVSLRRTVATDVAPTAAVDVHLLVHTGVGDRINFQAVVRHVMAEAGTERRIIIVTYDPGDGYSVEDYAIQPHEIWTVRQPDDVEELERILASAVKTLGQTYYPQAESVTVIDYRRRAEGPGVDPTIVYRELYEYITGTLVPLGVLPTFPLDPSVLQRMRETVSERVGDLESRPIVALHLRRRDDMPEKNPRRDDMIELARRLRARGFALVTFAEPGPPDLELESLASYTCPLDPAFQHPATLLCLCSALVGGDSGPAHIAAAVGTPIVSLRRPTENWVNGPFCPPDLLVPVEGTIVEDGGHKGLAFDVEAALAGVVTLIARRSAPEAPVDMAGEDGGDSVFP